jgi:hypothetical protein
MTAPRPVPWYKWVFLVICGCTWALPAVLAIPHMQLSKTTLVLCEALWSLMWMALAAHALAWFRIELNDRGVTKRGYFGASFIAWSEASIERDGYWFVVRSAKRSIRINPFIYRDPKELANFLSDHRPIS